jgi:hypothetical protein
MAAPPRSFNNVALEHETTQQQHRRSAIQRRVSRGRGRTILCLVADEADATTPRPHQSHKHQRASIVLWRALKTVQGLGGKARRHAGSSPRFTAPLGHMSILLDRRPQWGT